jgi:hypothetical protein
VDHVTVRGSNGLGVAMIRARFVAGSTRLSVEGSGTYPLYTGAAYADGLPPGTYTGNGTNEVLLQTVGTAVWANGDPLTSDVTLPDPGVPYRVAGPGIDVGNGRPEGPDATLTLGPGVTLRFAPTADGSARIRVNGALRDGVWTPQGALVVAGTAGRPVTLTSAADDPAAGDWQGLYFADVVHPASKVDHAVIQFGGGESYSTGVCKAANGATNYDADCSIIFFLEGDITVGGIVTNTRIAHGRGCGVYRGWHGTEVDFLSSNEFSDVAGCRQSNLPPPGQQVCDDEPCS